MATSVDRWRTVAIQAIVSGLVAGTAMVLAMRFVGWIPDIAWGNVATEYLFSILWAGGYAYLTTDQPFLSKRWWLSGPMFGLMVYIIMALVMVGTGTFVWPQTATQWAAGICIDALCFGLPLAFITAQLERMQKA